MKNIKFQINKKGYNPHYPEAWAFYFTFFVFQIKYRYSTSFGIFASDLQFFFGGWDLEFLWNPEIKDLMTWDNRCLRKGFSRRQWLSCRLYKNFGNMRYWKLFQIFESPKSYKKYVKAVNAHYWKEWKIDRKQFTPKGI